MDRDSGSTRPWGYLGFELEIHGGGPRTYPVSVRSPAGEAREEMCFPFDNKWKLENKLQGLEIALLRSSDSPGRGRRRIRSQEEQIVQDFGQRLFEALFVGKVRNCYEE